MIILKELQVLHSDSSKWFMFVNSFTLQISVFRFTDEYIFYFRDFLLYTLSDFHFVFLLFNYFAHVWN
jgi:hypothetical protein